MDVKEFVVVPIIACKQDHRDNRGGQQVQPGSHGNDSIEL